MVLDEYSFVTYRAPAMNTSNLSLQQLKRALQVREQIDSLTQELSEILGGGGDGVPSQFSSKKGRGMSAAGRARIAAAQRARWAKQKGQKTEKPAKGKRVMSAAAKAKIAAAARLRWKKAKAAGKTRL